MTESLAKHPQSGGGRKPLLTIGLVGGAVVALIGLGVLVVIGMRTDVDSVRRGEPAVVLTKIAEAQEKYRADSKGHGYMDISGRSEGGRIRSFYPRAHSIDDSVLWSTTCSEDESKTACLALQKLGVRAHVGTWLRYGGRSGVGAMECGDLASQLGVPPPPANHGEKPCFIALAVDGEGGRTTAWAFTSWDKKIRFVAGKVR